MPSFAKMWVLTALTGAALLPSWSQQNTDLATFFKEYAGLSQDQIREIQHGKTIARIVESPAPDQVFDFGAVYIESTPESYLKLAGNLDELRKLPGFLAIQKFSDPPQLSDLNDFSLDAEDLKELRECRPDHCEVQLPAEAMEEFQKTVNWSAPDAAAQANQLTRQMALQALRAYTSGGNAALGTYRDKKNPAQVADTFQSLLSQMKALPVYLPELNRYLLEYPKFTLAGADSQFYWEKVNFGLKPTLRIVQAIVYRGASPSEPAYTVAIKQIYSSHYFRTALDLSVCVLDASRSDARGFYLITLKGSEQAGLTGFKGGIVRHVAVGKSRSALERRLAAIKQQLEATPE